MRKAEDNKRTDFLQLLLNVQEQENKGTVVNDAAANNKNDSWNHFDVESDLKTNSSQSAAHGKKVLTDEVLVAHTMLFLLAGYDTTGNTISFAAYFLALNPDAQEKLFKEIDNSVKENGDLVPENVVGLPYLDKVIAETLRMYPAAIRLERRCNKDYRLGDIEIKKNMIVTIPVYCIHHDENYYPNPKVFDPERFSAENKAKRDPMTYIPFGAGPRNCIGMRFALIEAKLALAHFIREFKVSPAAETEIPIKFRNGSPLLSPMNGIKIKVEMRN